MVDEEMTADARAGVDINSGLAMRPLGHHARHERKVLAVEKMRDTLDGDGFEEGVGENDFVAGARGGVTLVGCFDVWLQHGPDGRELVEEFGCGGRGGGSICRCRSSRLRRGRLKTNRHSTCGCCRISNSWRVARLAQWPCRLRLGELIEVIVLHS